jgi:simple sugar transport system substrate-binding protein
VDGKLNCTVECNPLLGPQLFDVAEKIAAKQEVPKRVVVEEGIFPQEKAKELLPTRQY